MHNVQMWDGTRNVTVVLDKALENYNVLDAEVRPEVLNEALAKAKEKFPDAVGVMKGKGYAGTFFENGRCLVYFYGTKAKLTFKYERRS